jgi:hypothetical protein
VTTPKPPIHVSSPAHRYRNDPYYHGLVDMLEGMIHAAKYTPQEIRDAAGLAAIHYEMRRMDIGSRVVMGIAPAGREIDPHSPPDVVIVDGEVYHRGAPEIAKPEPPRSGSALEWVHEWERRMVREGR